jgi:hypothetical protein
MSPWRRLTNIATRPGDDPEEALQKRLQIAMTAVSVPAVGLWGLAFLVIGRADAALFTFFWLEG